MNIVDLLGFILPETKVNPFYQNPLSITVRVLFLSLPFFLVPALRAGIVRFFNAYGRVMLAALSVFLVLGYVAVLGWYGSVDEYFDHIEPSITSVSWLFAEGRPVYHGTDEPRLYNLPYGPVIFMINGIVLKLLGPSIKVSKLAAIFSFMSALALMFMTYRKVVGGKRALVFFGAMLLLLHAFGYKGFWVRSDPLILFCVAAGLWGAAFGRRAISVAIVALSLGLAVNLKVHSVFYLIPVLALMFARFGPGATFIAVSAAMAISALPFALFENISLTNYIDNMRTKGRVHSFMSGPFYPEAGPDRRSKGIRCFTFRLPLPLRLSALSGRYRGREAIT
jgi:hypothetical protein